MRESELEPELAQVKALAPERDPASVWELELGLAQAKALAQASG